MDADGRISLLLVDDEPLVLSSLRRHLKQALVNVRSAASADEALTLILDEVPDLVISDYQMPGRMTGVDLLARIHQQHPEVRCVLHTGSSIPEPEHDAFPVLSKPCAPEVLMQLIDSTRIARLHPE